METATTESLILHSSHRELYGLTDGVVRRSSHDPGLGPYVGFVGPKMDVEGGRPP